MSSIAEPRVGEGGFRFPFAGFDHAERDWNGKPRPKYAKVRAKHWVYPPVAPYDEYVRVLMPPIRGITNSKRRMSNANTDWRRILDEVCTEHRVAVFDVLSHRRARPLCEARHEAFYRLSEETNMSLPAIGKKMGGKDRTTVVHGILRHKERMVTQLSTGEIRGRLSGKEASAQAVR